MNINFHLEKYKGQSTRHECPSCHDPHSLTYYVDENGEPIDPTCGRCNHESACGYHYPPSQYFQDHPTDNKPMYTKPLVRPVRPKPSLKHICTIDEGYVQASMCAYQIASCVNRCSNFDKFLRSLFSEETVIYLHRLYLIGMPNSKDVENIIFWQFDSRGKARSGKIIPFHPDGHRIKEKGVNWLHSVLKKRGLLPDAWELNQCLFGEHLLNLFPKKKVALVESEKTAIIGAGFYPQFVWVATGGKSQLSEDKLKVLAGRHVIAFPDIDGVQEWKDKLKACKVPFRKLEISDILEKNENEEDRERKIDIADWLVRCRQAGEINAPSPIVHMDWMFDDYGGWLQPSPDAHQVIKQIPKTEFEQLCDNPIVKTLIDELELQPDDVPIVS